MRYFLLLLFICTAHAQSIVDLRNTIQEQKVELVNTLTKINELETANNDLTETLNTTKSNVTTLKEDIKSLTEWGMSQYKLATKYLDKFNKEKQVRLQTGRERDVFIVLFSILSTLYFYNIVLKLLNTSEKIAPFLLQYTWLPKLVLPVILFLASFYGVRLIVQITVKTIF